MGKKGPCYHCGIDSTPLWRNGPPEKPVLCNACGSRYRLCGNLENYVPKHALPLVKPKNLYSRANDHISIHANKQFSLGSIVSPQGKLNPSLWDSSQIHSKRRSEILHKRLSAMGKFKKQILSWWKQDCMKKKNKQSLEEGVLITQKLNNHMIPSNEIGLGGMLLKLDQQQ